MKITVLALDGVFDTGLSAVLDVLTTANEIAARQGQAGPPFEVHVAGVRRRIRTALGMTVSVAPVENVGKADWVVLPALSTKMPDTLLPSLERRDVADAMEQLRLCHASGSRIAAA